ncbi:MAG: gliding motility-associated-like protein [Crocinitomix sp.]|jgi:gliding motility-associated-like protein
MNEEGCVYDTLFKNNLVIINCDIEMSPLGTICQGDSITLTSVMGLAWLWSTGDTTESIIVAPTETTTYSLEVDGGVTAICEEITIYVHETQISTLPDSLTKCSNEELPVTAGVIGDYIWSTEEETEEIYIEETGTYYVSITDSNGCVIQDSIYVYVAEAPIWSLGETIYICNGDSVELTPIGEISGGEAYEWSTSETTPTIIVNEPGLYKLQLTDSICVTKDSVLVHLVYPWELALDNPFIICAKKVVLDVAQEFSSYLWSTGETSAQIIVEEPGLYGVEVTNVCGMYGGTIEVVFDCTYAFYVPNAFTVNGDPMNAIFKGVGVGVEQYYLNIYDRWGEIVFESNNMDFGWNGDTFAGAPAPMGVYVYQIEVIDILGELHRYSGHVSLIR